VYCKISVSQVEMAATWGRKVLLILCIWRDVCFVNVAGI
jgi:hypothetical protein